VHKGLHCRVEDLIAELKAGPSAGSGLFRAALAELAVGIRSEAEHDLKFRIDRSDLPTPMYNAQLYLPDGTFLAIADTWWPRAGVAGEVDSLRHHISTKDHIETMARHNRMEAEGINVLHFLPNDIKSDWPTIHKRIQGALANGMRKPPLPIIAVPADVADVKAYLTMKLSA